MTEFILQHERDTQLAFDELGIDIGDSPEKVQRINEPNIGFANLPKGRTTYAIEVVGMPGSGKSGLIKKYLEYAENRNPPLRLIRRSDKTANFREKYWHLKTADPYSYTVLKSEDIVLGYVDAIKISEATEARAIISDRGLLDRRVFLRAYFSQGRVGPEKMVSENALAERADMAPAPIGAIVLLMVRPEITMDRYDYWDNPGPVINMELLPLLYEQYWRLHYELLYRKTVPYFVYSCINAEGSMDMAYSHFSLALNTFFGL